jgi:hypothetical protein
MERLLIFAVAIEVRAFLFDAKHELPQGKQVVELFYGELGEGDQVPVQHAVTLVAPSPLVREKTS